MNFLSPWYAWLSLAALPLILFYFLKLRRPRRTVGSLALWRQALQDQRVNSPFQRFRKHRLLLLQLLALALLVFAATRPYRSGGGGRVDRAALMLDVSASMGATDADGRTRLDNAKEMARKQIRSLSGGQKMTLLAFSDLPRQLTPFTDDRRELEAALDSLTSDATAGQPDEALRMAGSLARAEPFPALTLISDGNLTASSAHELPFRVDYLMTKPAAANAGIIRLSARRAADGGWDVLVETAVSASAQSEPLPLALYDGERLLEQRTARPAPDKPDKTHIRLDGSRNYALRAVISPLAEDSLPSDNAASVFLPAARTLDVWAPVEMSAVRRALEAIGGCRFFPSDQAPPATFDLVISSNASDVSKPGRFRLFWGLTPTALISSVKSEQEPDSIVDWRREDPLFQHAQFNDVILMDTGSIVAGSWRQAGYSPLIFGRKGPICFENSTLSPDDGREIYFLPSLERTTLPYRIAFPVVLANAVQSVRQNLGLNQAEGLTPATVSQLRGKPGVKVVLTLPDGKTITGTNDDQGRPAPLEVRDAGVLRWRETGSDRLFAVSPLSEEDTRLTRTEKLDLGESTATATGAPETGKPLWQWLVWTALAVLAVEWLWFHKPGANPA